MQAVDATARAEFESLISAFTHLPPRDATRARAHHRAQPRQGGAQAPPGARCAAPHPALAEAIEAALQAINGTPGGRAQLRHAARSCWRPRRTGWPTGAWPPTRSTTGASSTSTTWPRCASRTRRCSRRPTAWCWSWSASGKVQGLRIDHPDGLYDPAQYFQRLQDRIAAPPVRRACAEQHGRALPIYLVVEKIAAGHERVPESWPVHGTTGYRFANVVNGLFVDTAARSRHRPHLPLVHRRGGLVRRRGLRIQARDPAHRLVQRAERAGQPARAHRPGRPAHPRLHAEHPAPGADRGDRLLPRLPHLHRRARLRAGPALHRVGGRARQAAQPGERHQHLRFRPRALLDRPVQGCAAELRAAGAQLRDEVPAAHRAGHRQGRGGHRLLPLQPPRLAQRGRRRSATASGSPWPRFTAPARIARKRWPHTMLASSTHDSKRSEDVRARINVLSEMPAAWRLSLRRWSRINRSKKVAVDDVPAPSANDEYLLYQTLLGSWPDTPLDEARLAAYRGRIEAYMIKAVREAKVHSSWINVNEPYEQAVRAFVQALLGRLQSNLFLDDFLGLQRSGGLARHAQQPVADADSAGLARRAGHLPGHRAVGLFAGGPRQPPPGRLGAAPPSPRAGQAAARAAARAARAAAAAACCNSPKTAAASCS